MGYYIGGDREDEGNYTPSFKRAKAVKENTDELKKIVQQQNVVKGIDLPTEFDIDYYKDKQAKFGKFSPDFWEWEKLLKYSKAVYGFYRQAICQFYAKFPPQDFPTKFEETAIGIKQEDLAPLAENLKIVENNLVSQFEKDGRTINATIKKYPALARLKEAAVRAWLMYQAVNKKLYVQDAINFKKSFSKFNLNDEICQLKTYRGCAVMKHYLHHSVSSNMLVKKLGLSKELYGDIDAVPILNELLDKVGGFKTTDYDNLLTDNQINNLNNFYPSLTNLYYNYGYINTIISLIYKNAETYYNQQYGFNEFCVVGGEYVDIYKEGEAFYNLTLELLNQNLPSPFVYDLTDLKTRLADVLNFAKKAYKNTVDEHL